MRGNQRLQKLFTVEDIQIADAFARKQRVGVHQIIAFLPVRIQQLSNAVLLQVEAGVISTCNRSRMSPDAIRNMAKSYLSTPAPERLPTALRCRTLRHQGHVDHEP